LKVSVEGLILNDANFQHFIALAKLIHQFEAFRYLTEAGMHPVQVLGVLPAQADKELRAACILAPVGHRQYAAVVVLVASAGLAFDLITRSAGACAIRASALHHKFRNDPMKGKPIVIATLCELYEICHRSRSVLGIKFHLQSAIRCFNFCVHKSCFLSLGKAMHKSLFAGIIFFFLAICGASAQKPAVAIEKDYDFTFITSVLVEDQALEITDFLDPLYNKDTLTGQRALIAAIVNELGLKHIFWIDGHGHGTTLEIHAQWVRNGGALVLDPEFRHNEALLKKARKAKGDLVWIEMADHDKGLSVWTGWIALNKIRAESEIRKMQKGVRLLMEQYPPSR